MVRLALSCMWLFLAALAASPASARTLVADLSDYEIEIDSGFSGTKLLLFGARNDIGDVLVSVRGPESRFSILKKERVAGIWVNREQVTFTGIPRFQWFAASGHFNPMNALPLLTALKLGPEYLAFTPTKELAPEKRAPFTQALLRYQYGRRLFSGQDGVVQFMGETLFRSSLPFPDTLPRGDYSVEVYLVNDGQISSMQTIPLQVRKSGMDAFLYDLAHRMPALYGLAAVLIALSAGWGVSYLFGRFNL